MEALKFDPELKAETPVYGPVAPPQKEEPGGVVVYREPPETAGTEVPHVMAEMSITGNLPMLLGLSGVLLFIFFLAWRNPKNRCSACNKRLRRTERSYGFQLSCPNGHTTIPVHDKEIGERNIARGIR